VLRRLKIFDYVAIVASLASVGGLAAYAYQDRGGGTQVQIESPYGQWIYPLNQDREVTIEGSQGSNTVVIHAGAARVVEASCRDKVCISMGAIATPGAWVACLPNRLLIRILGSSAGTDATAF